MLRMFDGVLSRQVMPTGDMRGVENNEGRRFSSRGRRVHGSRCSMLSSASEQRQVNMNARGMKDNTGIRWGGHR